MNQDDPKLITSQSQTSRFLCYRGNISRLSLLITSDPAASRFSSSFRKKKTTLLFQWINHNKGHLHLSKNFGKQSFIGIKKDWRQKQAAAAKRCRGQIAPPLSVLHVHLERRISQMDFNHYTRNHNPNVTSAGSICCWIRSEWKTI